MSYRQLAYSEVYKASPAKKGNKHLYRFNVLIGDDWKDFSCECKQKLGTTLEDVRDAVVVVLARFIDDNNPQQLRVVVEEMG